MTLNKIMGTPEGRLEYLEQLERRFSKAEDKIFLGKTSLNNLKESMNLFLYEADKQKDFENVIRI